MTHITSILKEYWKDKKFIKINLIAWLIVYFLFLLIEFSADGFASIGGYIQFSIFLIAVILIFYCQFFICEIFLEKNRFKFFLCIIFAYIIYLMLIGYLNYEDYKIYYKDPNYSITGFMIQRLFYSTICYLVIIFIAIIYWSLRNNSKKSKQNIELKQSNVLLQSQILQSELNFLRAQINPHFLQNCLNFIYSDTRKQSPKAADAVLLLSTIMRYSVADNTTTNGMALLTDEITQVENIIKIHQLRFEQKLNIIFNKMGDMECKQIVPMILLTLVENLIKYGDLNDGEHPAIIECSINEREKSLCFSASNKKAYATEIISTGLGLKNIRERLSLIWKDNFLLQKEEMDDYYIVKLSMPFKNIN